LPIVPEDLGNISMTADFTRQGTTYVSLVPRQNALDRYEGITNPPYTNLDMGVDWDTFYGVDGLLVQFYMTNVLKNKTVTGTNGGWFASGTDQDGDADPRMFGVTARYSF